jgi:hypothetical protein
VPLPIRAFSELLFTKPRLKLLYSTLKIDVH